jgi:pyocin large subunit-like protein
VKGKPERSAGTLNMESVSASRRAKVTGVPDKASGDSMHDSLEITALIKTAMIKSE